MNKKTCSRGHIFQKSSDCPVCPICWPGYSRKKLGNDLPATISAPALRALLNANINTIGKLTHYSESDILKLHGMGPASIPKLKAALKAKGLAFKK